MHSEASEQQIDDQRCETGESRPNRSTIGLAVAGLVRLALLGAALAGGAALVLPAAWTTDPSDESKVRALAGFVVLCCEVFAFHGGLALLAVGLAAVFVRPRWIAGCILLLGAVHAGHGLLATGRAIVTGKPPAIASGDSAETTLTVLSQNLLYSRARLEALAEIVKAERPDVIVLQEVITDRADEILARFGDSYPHVVHPATHRWGGMLLSGVPLVEVPEPFTGDPDWRIDQPVGVVEIAGARIAVVGVHLPAPNSIDQLVAGPRMTASFAEWVRERSASMPVVMAGDFNAPLWTSRTAPLREIGVRRAHDAAGAGRGSTWPSHRAWLRAVPGIRLDQAAWVDGPDTGLACVDSRVLGPTGSDHRPIVATFRVTAP